MISCVLGTVFYQTGAGNLLHFTKRKEGAEKTTGIDRTRVVFSLGNDRLLGLTVAIPYENVQQYNQLWKKYPKIRNDFLLKVQPEEAKKWVRERDFTAMKIKILEIVNENLNKPVKICFIESFCYE